MLCECDRVGDVAVALRDRWIPRPNFDQSVWSCLVAPPSRSRLRSSAGTPLVACALALAAIWLAAFLDRRVLHVRQPPSWFEPKSTWSFRWRLLFHLRVGHPMLRPCFVVAGHTESTRLQHTVALLNQLSLTLCSIVTWVSCVCSV